MLVGVTLGVGLVLSFHVQAHDDPAGPDSFGAAAAAAFDGDLDSNELTDSDDNIIHIASTDQMLFQEASGDHAAAPTIGLETNTGFYMRTGNHVALAVDGTHEWSWTGSVFQGFQSGGGSVRQGPSSGACTASEHSYNADTDTGVMRTEADHVGICAGNVLAFDVTEAGSAITTMLLAVPQADCAATCTTNELCYDTGGGTDELCICQTTDTWMCVSLASGQTD